MSEPAVSCTHCSQKSPHGTKFCTKCGQPLTSINPAATLSKAAPSVPASAVPRRASRPNKADWSTQLKAFWSKIVGLIRPGTQPPLPDHARNHSSQSYSKPVVSSPPVPKLTNPTNYSTQAPTMKLAAVTVQLDQLSPISEPAIAHQYNILKTIQLDTCNFYTAVDTQLAQPNISHKATHLIRERAAQAEQLLPPHQYIELANQHKIGHILPHEKVLLENGRIYTIMPHINPGFLSKIAAPHVPEKAITWTKHIAQALQGLHKVGFGHFWLGKSGREAIIIYEGEAWLTDLTFVQPIENNDFRHDVKAIASLLHYLLTGQELTANAPPAPSPYRTLLRRAFGGAIPDIPTFLQELGNNKQQVGPRRALRQAVGYLTDQGLERDHNEDYVGVFQLGLDQAGSDAPVGLYIVADGMGGHAAGEWASQGSVKQAFVKLINNQILPELKRSTRKLDNNATATPENQLKNLVQEANELVYNANKATKANRGTTITAALIIGDQAYIANVGDSRTYLLRNGQLQQITHDHSLVYSLYRANQISEDELYSHPRKNEIHRSLGDQKEVKIDLFNQSLQAGDKLLLCSDGLWEMVRNPKIREILMTSATPQTMCDQLIYQANQNGGVDNITAVIIIIE